MRIVGIDYGKKRIGLALSDASKKIAMPLTTVLVKSNLKVAITDILQALDVYIEEIEAIVVGLPVHLSGKESAMTKEVLIFIEQLKKRISIPIFTFDERLTSTMADKSLKELGYKRKKRDKLSDPIAATIMLQSYLDQKNAKI